MKDITFTPIGIVHSPLTDPRDAPIQAAYAEAVEGRIEIDAAFTDGLDSLAGFDRIWVLYHCHRSSGYKLRVVPYLDTVEHGVFATRAPRRPNAIGLSCLRLLSIDGPILRVAGLDILDRTPVLDIKPYIPMADHFEVSRCGWLDQVADMDRRADRRFHKDSPDEKG